MVYLIIGVVLWLIDSVFMLFIGEEKAFEEYRDDDILRMPDDYDIFKKVMPIIAIGRILLWPVTVIGSTVYLIASIVKVKKEEES